MTESSSSSVPIVGPLWARVAPQAFASHPKQQSIAVAQFACLTAQPTEKTTEEACRSLPLLLSEAITGSTSAVGQALLALAGRTRLANFRQPLTLAQALSMVSAQAVPSTLITGCFVDSVTPGLALEVVVTPLEAPWSASRHLVGDATVVGLASRLESAVLKALDAQLKLDRWQRPYRRAPLSLQLLTLLHDVAIVELVRAGRLDADVAALRPHLQVAARALAEGAPGAHEAVWLAALLDD